MKLKYVILSVICISIEAGADSSTLDAAIGGGVGGAAGAAIGHEIGGREGAIIGGAVGAAAGAAVTTEEKTKVVTPLPKVRYEYSPPVEGHPKAYHCPPGQRKKGRC